MCFAALQEGGEGGARPPRGRLAAAAQAAASCYPPPPRHPPTPRPANSHPPYQVEDLDLSLRKKDKDSSLAKLQTAQAKLDGVLSFVL